MSTLPKLTVITTGGTIDKDYPRSRQGYAFEFGDDTAASRLLASMPLLGFDVSSISVCTKDSTEVTADDRRALCEAVRRAPAAFVVVTHGTDTIVESAEAVRRSGAAEGKAVVFTGAMRPERFKDSDAPFNVGGAVAAASVLPAGSVAVCMGGRVIDSRRCVRGPDGHFLDSGAPRRAAAAAAGGKQQARGKQRKQAAQQAAPPPAAGNAAEGKGAPIDQGLLADAVLRSLAIYNQSARAA